MRTSALESPQTRPFGADVIGANSPLDPLDEGYPRSAAADLDPGLDLSESLDDADRAASDEHRVTEHRQPGIVSDPNGDFEDRDDAAYG
jgi:hypothetical protein